MELFEDKQFERNTTVFYPENFEIVANILNVYNVSKLKDHRFLDTLSTLSEKVYMGKNVNFRTKTGQKYYVNFTNGYINLYTNPHDKIKIIKNEVINNVRFVVVNGLIYPKFVNFDSPNLINDSVKITHQKLEHIKVLDASKVIRKYPQITKEKLHDIEQLKILTQSFGSLVYQFNETVLKFVDSGQKDDINGFYREIIIGLELNKLNSPNFVKTFGYYISDNGCQIPDYENKTDRDCIYLYIEKISGPTLKQFISTASLCQVKDIMLKLVKAYKLAHDKLDFCHYDLHNLNVIITQKNDEFIPVFIDFGASHIMLDEGTIGENWPEEGRYNDRSLWIYDMFKIFGFAWKASFYEQLFFEVKERYNKKLDLMDMEGNFTPDAKLEMEEEIKKLRENSNNLNDIEKYCRKVLKFFKKDFWIQSEVIEYQKNVSPYFSVSVSSNGMKAKLEDFIKYIETI